MSENKKYYYMKLKENFFTSERMVVLETMPDGILYSNLLLKMYLMSLKHNGILLLHENLPHTPQTIATFTRHQIGTVERALQIFLKLGFVELLTDGAYYMPDIQLLVGRSSTEAERKRRERLHGGSGRRARMRPVIESSYLAALAAASPAMRPKTMMSV